MNKTLLVAGGSHSDIPVILAAKTHGYKVFTSGNRAADAGHRFGDGAHFEDFSNPEAMLALARRLNISAICPSANDFSMISSAYVAEQLGLPGFDDYQTTLRLHHKDTFRALGTEIELHSPKARSFTSSDVSLDEIAGLRFPLIVKPIDLTGGKGISRIDTPAQFADALKLAFDFSRAKRIVVEEFFDGSLHSYSSIIKDGKVIFAFSDNEFSYLNPYTVTTSTTPALVTPAVLAGMQQDTERLARTLRLVDGVLHAQFLANGTNFRIIEYTRRAPGDLYGTPVRHSTGVDYADLVVRPYLGLSISAPQRNAIPKFCSRHCLLAASNGIFAGAEIDDEIAPNIFDRFMVAEVGYPVSSYLTERLGVFFLEYASEQEMQDKTARINQLIRARIAQQA